MLQAGLKRMPQWEAMIQEVSPSKRPAVPEELVDYIIFLCSLGANYINGTGLIIDAGATLTMHT